MYTPINSSATMGLAHIAALDISLHTLLGISWLILLPYTIFGACLMVYSQAKLLHGQHKIKRLDKNV